MILLIPTLHIVSFPPTGWTLLSAWEVWLYLKFKSNTIYVEEMGQDMPLSLSHSILATGQDNELI